VLGVKVIGIKVIGVKVIGVHRTTFRLATAFTPLNVLFV